MKAISIKQPWASFIIEGYKNIENRTWPTKFRGRILIKFPEPIPAKGKLSFWDYPNILAEPAEYGIDNEHK